MGVVGSMVVGISCRVGCLLFGVVCVRAPFAGVGVAGGKCWCCLPNPTVAFRVHFVGFVCLMARGWHVVEVQHDLALAGMTLAARVLAVGRGAVNAIMLLLI